MPLLAYWMVALLSVAADLRDASSPASLAYWSDGGKAVNVELRQSTGWATIRGFSWQLELEDQARPGTFAPADSRRVFRHGQRFRIRIESYCDQFLYVLVRNSDGSAEILLPKETEDTPRVARGATILLPPDNTAFHFTPPAGKEHLRVIASPVELPEAAVPRWFELRNGQPLDTRTTAQRLPTQVASLAQAAKDMAAGKLARGCEVVAAEPSPEGNRVLIASSESGCNALLVCDIVLKHEK